MKTWVLALFSLSLATSAFAAEQTLWEIGKPDHNTAKFALGPANYKAYHQPGFFVVGHSDPKKDWPYVQPGIIDRGWGPGKPQTFEILFALADAPQADCRLELYFADTQSQSPPRIRVEVEQMGSTSQAGKQDVVNSQAGKPDLRVVKEYRTPRGGGDASVFGDPSKGRPHVIRLDLPAGTLQAGTIRIAITTLTGSWVLWDAVRFVAPSGVKLGEVQDFLSGVAAGRDVLNWHEGKAAQAITVNVFHSGPPAEATLRVGDENTPIRLQPGMQTIEALVPPVKKKEVLPVTLSIGSQPVGQAKVELDPVRKWEVYILMHSHNDIGYTDIQPNIAKKQAHNVLRALELIHKTKDYPEDSRFKWNLEVLMPYEDFHPIATPEQEKQFEQAVRDGSIGVDAMYANLLTGVCRSEELLQQFSFATALGRRCGVKVDSMMISDVPGLTWGVVTALAQNGVRYISDGVNPGDRIGYARDWEDKPFYWLAPNGRDKVLYWAPYFGYAYGHGIDLITDAVLRDLAHLDKDGYPYDMVQIRWSKGDNGLPDERVMDQVRDWNARHASPRLIIATTSQMFHAFEQRYGDKLPTFRGDFTPYWEDGVASSARETGMNRQSADRLLQVETIWAAKGLADFPAADFAAAWKNVALYSEHTWGAYNSISAPDLPFVKEQWKFKQAWALDADRQSRKLLGRALAGRDARAGAVDVFNTASWPRTDLVTLSRDLSGKMSAAGERIEDEQGREMPAQRLSSGELVFLARDVPPFGSRRYQIKPGSPTAGTKATASGTTLATPALTVKLDSATGAVTSLRRRGIDAELVDGQVNGYLYLPGGNVKDAQPNGPATVTIKESGPLVASLLVESQAPGCRKLLREVRVVDGLDRLEMIDQVDKLPIRSPEGVHFAFQFNVPDARVRVNSPLAVVEPEKDQLHGACKNWFSVERWVDVANDHYGVTWTTTDAPLMEMGGLTANLPRQQPNPRAYLDKIAASPKLYSWAMNNHWETNSRAEQEGWTTFRYAIRPHGTYDAVSAARFGVESTMPLVAAAAVGDKPAASRLTIKPANLLATALKPSDDGKAIIVRLYGASGKNAVARLTWSQPVPKAVWLSDASEQPLNPAAEAIEVPAWSIVTLRAEMP